MVLEGKVYYSAAKIVANEEALLSDFASKREEKANEIAKVFCEYAKDEDEHGYYLIFFKK